MLLQVREPYLLFVQRKRKHDFLYKESLEIYKNLIENSDERLPIIGYDRLVDMQTFFDIRNTLFPNANDLFEERHPDSTYDGFIEWFQDNQRDLMEELVEDLICSFRYHLLFFIKEICPVVPGFANYGPDQNIYTSANYPVRKVW